MSSAANIIKPIEDEMEQFQVYFKTYLKSNAKILNILVKYLLKTKGKQLRPMLVFLSARLHGQINQSTYNAASLIELMHTATLVHDDVVDDSNMRRGFFSINALWKNKVAVLLGDFLLAKGLLLAVDNNEFEQLRIVSRAVKDMSEGELTQIEKARKLDIDEDTYFEIIRKKTAALMVACTSAGAKSVGVNNDVQKKMELFGEYLGIAFQIRDDLFDFDRNGKFGKPAGNDIKERKLTLPMIHALKQCTWQKKSEILKLMRLKDKNPDNMSQIVKFVTDYGGIDYACKTMDFYCKSAIEILNTFPNNDANKALVSLVNYTANRKK